MDPDADQTSYINGSVLNDIYSILDLHHPVDVVGDTPDHEPRVQLLLQVAVEPDRLCSAVAELYDPGHGLPERLSRREHVLGPHHCLYH